MKIMENATKGDQKALGALDNIAVKFGTDNFMEKDFWLGIGACLPIDISLTLGLF